MHRGHYFQQHYWPNLKIEIRTHIKGCKTFQENKKQNLKYGKLPAKETGIIPRDRL